MVQIAMLGAVAFVLMAFEFPLPFLAPPFYELDFSEVPVLIGTFSMGPVAGILIEALKIMLNLLIKGTKTFGVGDLANFLMGCCFIVPAGIIYKLKKTRKNALVGMIIGIITMCIAACFLNAFLLLPMYANAYGMPIQAFIDMGTQVVSAVHDMFTFAMFCIVPFNLFKGILVCLITNFIYKPLRHLLK